MRCYRIALTLGVLAMPMGLAAQSDSTADSTADSTLAQPSRLGSRTTIRGAALWTLFADDPQHVLGLVPGVVLRQAETGLARAGVLSIRGGVPGGASVYIDGAPVRFLSLGLASVAEVSVTTGVPDLALPDVGDGVIEYVTQGGSQKFAGGLRAVTDEAFTGAGFSRFEGSVGGPLLGLANSTFFVGGTLMGQRSHYVGMGAEDVPSFIPAAIDTVIGTETLFTFRDERAYDWGTDFRGHAKVQLALPAGASLTLTGVANELQERFFPGPFALAPTLYQGSRASARLVVGTWHQPLGSLMLHVNGSIGSNRTAAGLLEPWAEPLSRDPGLGITLETLRFNGDDSIPTPVTDEIIRNVRTNSGMRAPLLNRDDLRNAQTSRGNPFGMVASWPGFGMDGSLSMSSERRADGRVALEWIASNAHHVTVGGDLGKADVSSYESNLLRQSFMDVYRSEPGRAGLFVSDRLTRGDWRADVALRFDHFGSVGLFPTTPGRIYSHPAFNRPAAITTDTGYTNSVARVMTPGQSHSGMSIRTAVERSFGSRGSLRASFGRWLEPPPLGLVLRRSNSDLDFTNTNDLFGRDVDYGFATQVEFGFHRIERGVGTDVAVYRRTGPQYVSRIAPFDDPANPGDIVNANVLSKEKDRVDWGLDLALDWRTGDWLTARTAYSFRRTDTRLTSNVPAYVTHALTGALVVRPPGGWLAGFEGSALIRVTSGTAYVPVFGGSSGQLTPFVDDVVGALQHAQTPATKRVDVRLRRTVSFGSSHWSFFAEARNLFAWQNVLRLFTETGSVTNANFRAQLLDDEFVFLGSEASNNGALAANGDIMLPANCATWIASPSGGETNCIALKRVEARFGNGDAVYTLAERTTALDAFYKTFFGPQTLYGSGRTVRLGVEIRW